MEYKVKITTHDTRQSICVVNDIIRSLGHTRINELEGPHEIEINIHPIKKNKDNGNS